MPPAATSLHFCSSGGMPPSTLSGQTKPMISMSNYYYTTTTMSSTNYSPRYYALSSGNRFCLTSWFHTSSDHHHHHMGYFPLSAKKSDHQDDVICDADSWLSDLEVKPPPSPPAAVLPRNPDLLKIPRVGPKNLTKLVENDIAGVNDLKKIYKDKFYKSRKSNQKMVEFLQSSVGIKNRNHAKSITAFIKNTVTNEIKDAAAGDPPQKKKG